MAEEKTGMSLLEDCFYEAINLRAKFIAVKIKMEGFSKPEIIINQTENFESKLNYYKKSYSNDLKLRSFSGIEIIDFCYGNTFCSIFNAMIGE